MYCKMLYNRATKTYTALSEQPLGYSHGVCPSPNCVTRFCLDNTTTEEGFNSMLEEILRETDETH